MGRQPLAEVFGFRIDDRSDEANRHRTERLCPFNNKGAKCNKDKADDPLGVCSIYHEGQAVIICPIRFREKWQILDDAAGFFFPSGTRWTSFAEIQLKDRHGVSAGNIDIVLAAYNEQGQVIDFGALEVQAVYISGNVRKPFAFFMQDPNSRSSLDWSEQKDYPRPDYLSSSRKRLVPQLLYKGNIFRSWNKKIAVAIDRNFLASLPNLPETTKCSADIAWLVYDLKHDLHTNRFKLTLVRTLYTEFSTILKRMTAPEPGNEKDFLAFLQRKLRSKQMHSNANGDISPEE